VPSHTVRAVFPGYGCSAAEAGCFDVLVVLSLLEREYGDSVQIDPEDLAWNDYESVLRHTKAPANEGAVRVAERDAQRRGPRFRFAVMHGARRFEGAIERHRIAIHSEEPIPEGVAARFEAFLNSLPIGKPEIGRETLGA